MGGYFLRVWLIVGQTKSYALTDLSCCKNVFILAKNLVQICLVLYLSLEFRPLVFTTRHCSVQAEPGCLGNTKQQTQTLLQSKITWCSLTPRPRPLPGPTQPPILVAVQTASVGKVGGAWEQSKLCFCVHVCGVLVGRSKNCFMSQLPYQPGAAVSLGRRNEYSGSDVC